MMTDTAADNAVTKIVDRVPLPGKQAQLEAAIRALSHAVSRYPGHLGITVLAPHLPAQPGFRLLYKFDTVEHLQAWENSEEQHRLVAGANRYTQGAPRYHSLTGLEAWFTIPPSGEPAPSRARMTVVSWIGIFPLVLGYGSAVNALAPLDTPSVLRVLVTTALVVPTMAYVVGPQLTRAFRRWLYHGGKR